MKLGYELPSLARDDERLKDPSYRFAITILSVVRGKSLISHVSEVRGSTYSGRAPILKVTGVFVLPFRHLSVVILHFRVFGFE